MTNGLIVRVSLAAVLMCSAGGAWAQGKTDKADKASQTFITKAIQGNLAEVSMGQLAQQQGNSAEVKSFGQQLVTDHSAANQRATSLASQMGVTPPSEPTKNAAPKPRAARSRSPAKSKAGQPAGSEA